MGLLPISIRSREGKGRTEYLGGSVEEVVGRAMESLRQALPGATPGKLYERVISQVEKALVTAVLERNSFIQSRAAEELGLSRNTLRKKMRKHGIPPT